MSPGGTEELMGAIFMLSLGHAPHVFLRVELLYMSDSLFVFCFVLYIFL